MLMMSPLFFLSSNNENRYLRAPRRVIIDSSAACADHWSCKRQTYLVPRGRSNHFRLRAVSQCRPVPEQLTLPAQRCAFSPYRSGASGIPRWTFACFFLLLWIGENHALDFWLVTEVSHLAGWISMGLWEGAACAKIPLCFYHRIQPTPS